MAKSERVAVARWLSASCRCLSLDPDYVSFLRMVLVRDHAHLRQAALPHLQAFQAVGCPQPLGLEPRVFSGTHSVLSTLPLMRPLARTASMAGQVGVASSRQKQRTVALQIDSGADPQIIPAAGWEVLQTDSLPQEKVVAQPRSGPRLRSRKSAVLIPPPPGEHGWIRIPTATGETPCSPSLISDQMATSAKPQRCIPIKNRIVRSVKVQYTATHAFNLDRRHGSLAETD